MKINALVIICLPLVACSSISPQHTESSFPFNSQKITGLSEIDSFDIYKDDTVLHALVSGLKTQKDTFQTIHHLQSDDEGKHWTSPIEIQHSATIATRGNDVQIAANGKKLVAVWQTQGEMPNYGALSSVYSQDGGKTWQIGKNPAVDNSGDQSHADLIADKKGNFHVVWLADPDENGYQSLRYSHSIDKGISWQPPQKLDDSSCSCCSNTLTTSENNQLHVLYRDMNPRDMVLLSSNDDGKHWQTKKTVGEFNWHFDGCPHIGGGITFDEKNNFYASVWTGEPSKSGLYVVNSITDTPVKISQNGAHSDIAILNNQIVVVWDERTKEGTGIFAAKSTDKGITWSTPNRLSENGTNSTHPRIITNEDDFLIFWTEKKPNAPSLLNLTHF